MPNWCYNSVSILHNDKDKIDAIEKALANKEDWFSVIHPRPNQEEWYEWNTENWGTKWSPDPDCTEYEKLEDNKITITFQTAWSPPIELYKFMEENEFSVKAMYHDESNTFIGRYSSGADECYEYDYDDLATIEAIPEDLVEFGNIRETYEDYQEDQSDADTDKDED